MILRCIANTFGCFDLCVIVQVLGTKHQCVRHNWNDKEAKEFMKNSTCLSCKPQRETSEDSLCEVPANHGKGKKTISSLCELVAKKFVVRRIVRTANTYIFPGAV